MANTRARWEVWQRTAKVNGWVQGPKARVDFATEKAARNVAKRGAELDAIEASTQRFGTAISRLLFGEKGGAQ